MDFTEWKGVSVLSDWKKIYAKKAEAVKRIKKTCPTIPNDSGIYLFYRTDEAGIKRGYCGQAVALCDRCASHLLEYDHIALSLKKHGLCTEDNPSGWNIWYHLVDKEHLDEEEVKYIKMFGDQGIQMYNITAGSQGQGKMVTGVMKPGKGYRDGLAQGKINLARELANIADKHLVIGLKTEKQNNSVSQKQFAKFMELLHGEKDGKSNE